MITIAPPDTAARPALAIADRDMAADPARAAARPDPAAGLDPRHRRRCGVDVRGVRRAVPERGGAGRRWPPSIAVEPGLPGDHRSGHEHVPRRDDRVADRRAGHHADRPDGHLHRGPAHPGRRGGRPDRAARLRRGRPGRAAGRRRRSSPPVPPCSSASLVAAAGIGVGEPAAGSVAARRVARGRRIRPRWRRRGRRRSSPRTPGPPSALSAAVLAGGFLLRAVGDVEPSVSWLSWLSPQGLGQQGAPVRRGQRRSPLLISVAGRRRAARWSPAACSTGGTSGWRCCRPGSARRAIPRLRSVLVPRRAAAPRHADRLAGRHRPASAPSSAGSRPAQATCSTEQPADGAGAGADRRRRRRHRHLFITALGGMAGLIVGGYAISAALRMTAEEIGGPGGTGAGHRRAADVGG